MFCSTKDTLIPFTNLGLTRFWCTCERGNISVSHHTNQFPACLHRWFCYELVLLLNAGWVQCLSLVCCWRPSCCCRIPWPQDGGPPLWLWCCWIHSLALGSSRRSIVHGGVPCAILWIWCESKRQGWYMFVWVKLIWRECLLLLVKSVCFLLGAAAGSHYIVFAPIVWLHITEVGVCIC